MNILVIGNGFDLAHGLPTKYKDFLDYIIQYKEKKVTLNGEFANEFETLIYNNVWIDYFTDIYKGKVDEGKGNWIDFESEISQIVQKLDEAQQYLRSFTNSDRKSIKFSEQIYASLKPFIHYEKLYSLETFAEEKVKILDDLNKLTRCLEIYLIEVVEKINIDKRLADFNNIDIDHVLSFNYTNTYERIYGSSKLTGEIEYDYIHGKADESHNLHSCNLVLGIDEYLNEKEKDINTDFIQYKKYYQRIYKKTGCKYKDWIKENNEIYNSMQYIDNIDNIITDIYIIGHSLDVTDKDIFRELINMPGTRTTIYYHNDETLGKLIINMVKLIGQDQLTERVYGDYATIVFKELQS